jgi:zinc transport system substrate-binding protein
MSFPARASWSALVLLWLITEPATAAPKVVASIKPVDSLVAGVMRGLGAPVLLVSGGGSPHGYSLRPSAARALNEADLVFWVGSGLEAFLAKPIEALAGGHARVIALAEAEDVRLLKLRRSGVWDTQDEAVVHNDTAGHGPVGSADFHIWLDPQNAIAIVRAAVTALARADPENASRYRQNGASTIAQIQALDREIAGTLSPVRERAFVVFHDAYQYFEQHYGLSAAGALAVSPERPPGARRLAEIRAKIAALDAVCVFAEPQFRPALLDTVIAGSAARSAVLDPLGAALPAGPEAYFALMRGLAASLAGCLSPDG